MTRKTSKASTEAAAFYHRSAAAVDVRRVPTGKPTSQLSRSTMVCVLVLSALLLIPSASSSAGTDPALSCPSRWLLLGQRCLAFYPVWSCWSDAKLVCSQSGADLVSIYTPEDQRSVARVANTAAPVWLGGYQGQQNGSWFWSDGSPLGVGLAQRQEAAGGAKACVGMTPTGGELHSAPCEELRFYICSMRASSAITNSTRKQPEAGLVPGVDLFDVVWSKSDVLPVEILHSSSFLKELQSGHMTQSCYSRFMQQEALYMSRVSSTLEVLIRDLQEADDTRSLLLDTLKLYSSTNQSDPASPPPRWLRHSLHPFHSVVLEEPVYWLVALSARARLRNFLAQELLHEPLMSASSFYQEWSKDSLKEVAWLHRYKEVLKENQDHMDVFKAINIFREHMMAQKALYKAAVCEAEDGK